MAFYEEISKYYDYIFPVGEAQLKLLKEYIGTAPQKVLDIACGSGGYSVELAKAGNFVSAIDYNAKMIEFANKKTKEENLSIDLLQCSMLELANNFKDKNLFDFVFCIGNSIVHLQNIKEIQEALIQMYKVLDNKGKLLIQIINFDKIIKNNSYALPTLKNNEIGLEFIRNYQNNFKTGKINFDTILNIKNNKTNESYKNSIELFPVLSTDIRVMLTKAGFKNINFYGDFSGNNYNEDSFLLVAKAEKIL